MNYSFQQIDVFSKQACMGNPVAVFLESNGLSTESMQTIARWTNLSETTFVAPSTVADYKVRIFTPTLELPFAGHPTLGTAFALRQAGVIQKDNFIQECDFGLIQISCQDDKIFFELPHFSTQVLEVDRQLSHLLGVDVIDTHLITTGPRWITAQLKNEHDLFKLSTNLNPISELLRTSQADGVVVYTIADNNTVHLRAFFEGSSGVIEDPVCGSGNAAVAAHIITLGHTKRVGFAYEAFQGTALKRDGRISVILGDKIKVGGQCHGVFRGIATF